MTIQIEADRDSMRAFCAALEAELRTLPAEMRELVHAHAQTLREYCAAFGEPAAVAFMLVNAENMLAHHTDAAGPPGAALH